MFHNDEDENIIYICAKCHNEGKYCLEELIRERENDILRTIPDLYYDALEDYKNGVRPKKKRIYIKKRRLKC